MGFFKGGLKGFAQGAILGVPGALYQGITGKSAIGMGKGLVGLDDYKIQEDPYGRNQQVKLSDMLMARAKGETPSLAEAQTKAGMQQNLEGMQASIRGQGGINAGLRQRMLRNKGFQTGQEAARQGGLARMNEQMETEKSLGGLLSQMRDADLGREKLSMDSKSIHNKNKQSMIRSLGSAMSSAATGGAGGAGGV